MLDLPSITYQQLSPNELKQLKALDPSVDLKVLKDLASSPSYYVCILQSEDVPIGYIVTKVRSKDFVLWSLFVAPAYRRQGLGRFLLEQMKLAAKGQKLTSVAAFVSERNLLGQQFLRSCGFLYEKTKEKWFKETDDAYWFVWRNE